MVEKLSFLTPINFDALQSQLSGVSLRFEKLGRLTEYYWSRGDHEALLLSEKSSSVVSSTATSRLVMITNRVESHYLFDALRYISWIFILPPLLMLIGKVVFRVLNNFIVLKDQSAVDIINKEQSASEIEKTASKRNLLFSEAADLRKQEKQPVIQSIKNWLASESLFSFGILQTNLKANNQNGTLLKDEDGRLWVLAENEKILPVDWGEDSSQEIARISIPEIEKNLRKMGKLKDENGIEGTLKENKDGNLEVSFKFWRLSPYNFGNDCPNILPPLTVQEARELLNDIPK